MAVKVLEAMTWHAAGADGSDYVLTRWEKEARRPRLDLDATRLADACSRAPRRSHAAAPAPGGARRCAARGLRSARLGARQRRSRVVSITPRAARTSGDSSAPAAHALNRSATAARWARNDLVLAARAQEAALGIHHSSWFAIPPRSAGAQAQRFGQRVGARGFGVMAFRAPGLRHERGANFAEGDSHRLLVLRDKRAPRASAAAVRASMRPPEDWLAHRRRHWKMPAGPKKGSPRRASAPKSR